MKIMNRTLFAFIVILYALLCVKCDEIDEDYGGAITEINFSNEWNSSTGHLGPHGILFNFGLSTIYYEIKFEGEIHTGIIVKKGWQLPNSLSIDVHSFIPKYSRRICGELHYYDLTEMPVGTYQLSVYYREDGVFSEYNYGPGVNREFSIE